ncbi:hypothetical protein Leryth_006296 [Lithospermum erythrorhizon]|nr:hypothetical protein Leryth_006296 [Lithospermum erythrorhizon]
MSTIVYQGLHSYFESQLVETTTLKLRVASCMVGYETKETKEKCHIQETNYKNPNHHEYSCFGSIQNLSNVPYTPKETTLKQSSYIHPLTNKSPRLSQKSLELCTETLGSETGCDTMDISILSLNSSDNTPNVKSPSSTDSQKLPKQMKSLRSKAHRSFPPPLTTMRGPNSIQIRPYREEGRLVIEAFETPSRNSYLQAERSNGRLIISFINDSANNLEPEMTNEDNENDVIEINEHENDHEGNYHEDYERIMNEDMDAEGEISTENIQIPGRYNENQHGNKPSCFWRKPLCVATS